MTIFRSMFKSSSTIYPIPETHENASEKLKSCAFDTSKASGSSKVVRRFERHNPARGTLPIRELGGHKYRETNFMKR